MSLTLLQAHDAINSLADAVCVANDLTLISQNVPLTPDQQALIDGTTDPIRPWARITIKENIRSQETIASSSDCRRFENQGIVTVELYTPSGDGSFLNDTLAPLLRNAYEGVNVGSLWFRNAVVKPVGVDGPWFHSNVVAEFIWDEVR